MSQPLLSCSLTATAQQVAMDGIRLSGLVRFLSAVSANGQQSCQSVSLVDGRGSPIAVAFTNRAASCHPKDSSSSECCSSSKLSFIRGSTSSVQFNSSSVSSTSCSNSSLNESSSSSSSSLPPLSLLDTLSYAEQGRQQLQQTATGAVVKHRTAKRAIRVANAFQSPLPLRHHAPQLQLQTRSIWLSRLLASANKQQHRSIHADAQTIFKPQQQVYKLPIETLASKISDAATSAELVALITEAGSKVNHIHVALLLRRLATLKAQETGRRKGLAMHLTEAEKKLVDDAMFKFNDRLNPKRWSPSTLALIWRTLARLGLNDIDKYFQPSLDLLQKLRYGMIRKAVPGDLADIMWAAAKVGITEPLFWNIACASPMLSKQDRITPRRWSEILWAVATIQREELEICNRFRSYALSGFMKDATPSLWGAVLWAMSLMHYYDRRVCDLAVQAIAAGLTNAVPPSTLGSICHALGHLYHAGPTVHDTLLSQNQDAMIQLASAMPAKAVISTLWMLAAQGILGQNIRLVEALVDRLNQVRLNKLDTATLEQLAQVHLALQSESSTLDTLPAIKHEIMENCLSNTGLSVDDASLGRRSLGRVLTSLKGKCGIHEFEIGVSVPGLLGAVTADAIVTVEGGRKIAVMADMPPWFLRSDKARKHGGTVLRDRLLEHVFGAGNVVVLRAVEDMTLAEAEAHGIRKRKVNNQQLRLEAQARVKLLTEGKSSDSRDLALVGSKDLVATTEDEKWEPKRPPVWWVYDYLYKHQEQLVRHLGLDPAGLVDRNGADLSRQQKLTQGVPRIAAGGVSVDGDAAVAGATRVARQ